MVGSNKKNRVGFLITGRLKSKRLPKKIMLEVAGKPLFSHMCDRLKLAKDIDEIILCTSINAQDDPLVALAQKEGISSYRGSEIDVLQRLYEAARHYSLDYLVNITADCPLIDPFFVDLIVAEYNKTNADLIRIAGLPRGQGPNGIKVSALKKVCQLKNETETEVWGDYFTKSGLFHYQELYVGQQYFCPGLKTSIDYPEDYEFIKQLFANLYSPNKLFSLSKIIDLIRERPELLCINAHCINLGKRHTEQTRGLMSLKENRRSYEKV